MHKIIFPTCALLLCFLSFTPLAQTAKPVAFVGSPVLRETIVYGQETLTDPSDKTKHQYQVRDGLTPQVILQLAKKAVKKKNIDESWLGDLDCLYGHYTSPSGIEALVFSRDGSKSHAEIYTHVWLLGLKGSRWSLLKNIGAWDIVKAQIVDVNGDGLDEVMLSGSGGNGLGYYEGVLYSLKGNRLDKLYHNVGHGNWVQGFHPDYKQNILERLYTVSFTSPDSAGIRALVEQQDLLMGSRISNDPETAPTEQFEEKGMKYITTRFHLQNGHYRPIPHSASTTAKPVKMDTIIDASVRISVPLGNDDK